MTASPRLQAVLAIDVGGTTIKAEVVDADGSMLTSSRVATPHGPDALNAIGDAGTELMASVPVTAAAVGLPGIVDRHAGIGIMSANVGWRDLPVAEPLRRRWGLPVAIDHDVTLAGWAEWQRGAGRGVDDLCFVSIGTGISATHVIDGRLVRGGAGQAGELGHVPTRNGDQPCGCGARGCLETVASAISIERAYAERTGSTGVTAEDIIARAPTDPDAAAAWQAAIDALADGLAYVVSLLGPSRIVIGGGLSGAGDILTDALQDALEQRVRVVGVPPVVTGAFGARAGIVGAAMLARTGSTDNGV